MSAETQPISPQRFASALHDLPAENLYSKAHELENSIAHLERSNKSLQEYIDSIVSDTQLPEATRQEGDKECSDAIKENNIVIERQKERVALLKQEVERRGARWHGSDPNGSANVGSTEITSSNNTAESNQRAGGRLTDEQLRRQMMDRLGNDEDDDEADGMHL